MVELALILPVLLGLTFGIIEYGWMFYCVAQINLASRGGVRTAVRPQATETEVKSAIAQVMNQMNWQETTHYTVVIEDLGAPVGDPVTVRVSIPYDLVGFGLPIICPQTLGGHATMAKEGPE